MSNRSVSLRAQIFALVLGVAIVPLAVVGLWLTSRGVRAGEDLLHDHLEASADRYAAVVHGRWEFRRGDMALIAGNDATVRAVTRNAVDSIDGRFLESLANALSRSIASIELRDTAGRSRWSSTPASRAVAARSSLNRVVEPAPPTGPLVQARAPIVDAQGKRLGEAVLGITLASLVPGDSARPLIPGGSAGVRAIGSPNALLRMQPGAPFPTEDSATVGKDEWMVVHRVLDQVGIEIAVGAPVAPYVERFRRAGRVGLLALFAVALVAITVAGALARRMSRPLERLAEASDAVTRGELNSRAETGGPTEVRRVGGAFNSMTENLRTTLDELSRRNALAAIGEFATSLSHDVRNALTSIKVDLERADRRRGNDNATADLVTRALNNVSRLEATVTGALHVARAGHAPPSDIDVRDAVRAATESVSGSIAALPGELIVDLSDEPCVVRGSPTALQQMFANLLFNAAQSLRPGGRISVTSRVNGKMGEVTIADTGVGIDQVVMARIAASQHSTKPNGSGLGLPIARRIVASHGGTLTIESTPGAGTTVQVRLPRLHDSSAAIERDVQLSAASPNASALPNA